MTVASAKAKPNQDGKHSGGGAYRELPSVASLMTDEELRAQSTLDSPMLVQELQLLLERERTNIASGERLTRADIRDRVIVALRDLERPRLAPVLNATGIIVHTNLGRAPVSDVTAQAMAATAANYAALEIEPDTNQRGARMREIGALMRLLTGAEETLIVNNNAAAILLALTAIASGRSVVLSRGEAVEIGGGFRIPDVLRQSGASLIEVGTTNRTYARDYLDAIDETVAALLKVHPSNFAMSGFTHSATVSELAEVAKPLGMPVIEDLGSGALLDTSRFGLAAEPTIGDSLAAGAAVVTASGDKLLGGPQAGIIAGRQEWIATIAAHPLARAVRADKTCLAGIAATLRHYARGEAEERIPVWRMIAMAEADIRSRCDAILEELHQFDLEATSVQVFATVGGGSLPGQLLPSHSLAVRPADSDETTVDGLARQLRTGNPAVFGRIEADRLLLDLRTILPEDDHLLTEAIMRAVKD